MRIRHIRPLAVVAALALGAVGIAACSAPEDDDGTTELTLLAFDGGVDVDYMADVIAAFEEANEGITVSATYVPENQYVTKLQTSLLADPPDIARNFNFGTILNFQPIDDMVFGAHDIAVDDFNATLTSACSWDGKIYCVGTTIGNMVIFYNKAVFDEIGLPYPDVTTPMTFDELADVASQLTQPGPTDADTVFGVAPSLLVAYMDPANVLDETGRTVEVTKPEFADTVQTLADLVATGDSPSGAQAEALGGDAGALAMFLEGKIGMLIADNFVIEDVQTAGIDFGIAPTPIVDGFDPWIVSWTNGFGIPQGAEHSEEAAAFLAFLATEGQRIQAEHGVLPLNDAYAGDWADTEQREQLVQVSTLVRPSVFNPNQWAWNAPVIDAIDAALRGEPTLSALEDAQPRAQQGNDTTWEEFDRAVEAANAG